MNWARKVLRSGIAALVCGALLVSVSPASAADSATDIGPDDVHLVMDLDPGSVGSHPRDFTVLGDLVLFSTDDGVHGRELWVTDGTTVGTTLVKDINPGPGSGRPLRFTVFGDQVLFSAADGVHGHELWVTDGTTAGTTLVKDINPVLASWPGGLTVFGDRVLFRAGGDPFPSDHFHDQELWISDGTAAGTMLVKDINPGPVGSHPGDFVVLGDEALFTIIFDDGGGGGELWATDGTAAGTRLVKDALPGPEPSWPSGFAVLGDRVLFEAGDGESRDLWVTDGTTEGTQLVKDFAPSAQDLAPGQSAVFGDRALFGKSDGEGGRDLWSTDGTTAGTQLVKAFPGDFGRTELISFTAFGDRLLFISVDFDSAALWVTDGTTDGTVLVKGLDPGGEEFDPWWLTVFGDRVLFTGADLRGRELWVTDGTQAGTELLKDINPTGNGYPSGFTVTGNQVLFTADDGVRGFELWSITPGFGARIDDQLTRLYQAAYGRTPDSTGLDYWADRYRSGTSLVEIAGSFLVSAEFVARNGPQPTNPEFVDGLYRNVAGRSGDQTSRNYWLRLLDTGTTRAEVLVAFSESPTNVARTNTIAAFTSTQAKVVRLYGAAFGRAPDITGFAFWTNVLDNGASLTSIATQFRASPEFAERYGPDTSNEAFVRLLYTNVLDRAPDPAGLAFWLAQLDTTYTRDQVLVAFSESPENIDRTNTTR